MTTTIPACRICRAPLSLFSDSTGNSVWLHPANAPADHPPLLDWVDALDALSFCDVCSAPGPKWRITATSFTVHTQSSANWRSEGDWALCNICDDDVSHERVDALVARAVAKHGELPPRTREVMRRDLHKLFTALLQNRTGTRTSIW